MKSEAFERANSSVITIRYANLNCKKNGCFYNMNEFRFGANGPESAVELEPAKTTYGVVPGAFGTMMLHAF